MLSYSVFFFKQKTAYEMRISDWSSDVCSSDLRAQAARSARIRRRPGHPGTGPPPPRDPGRRWRHGSICRSWRDDASLDSEAAGLAERRPPVTPPLSPARLGTPCPEVAPGEQRKIGRAHV